MYSTRRAALEAVDSYGSDQGAWPVVLVFAGIQLALVQVPNLDSAWISSTIGSAMSLGYSTIALGLSAAKAGNRLGSVGGRSDVSPAEKAFGVMNCIGALAFAFNFSVMLPEIQVRPTFCCMLGWDSNNTTYLSTTCNNDVLVLLIIELTLKFTLLAHNTVHDSRASQCCNQYEEGSLLFHHICIPLLHGCRDCRVSSGGVHTEPQGITSCVRI